MTRITESHNDYWNARPFIDAYTHSDYNFNMFEADIIYTCGKFELAHSIFQRQYGSIVTHYLQPMYQTCMEEPETHLWLDIEFKSAFDEDAFARILRVYQTNPLPKLDNLHYIVNVIPVDSWKTYYRKGRQDSAEAFYRKYAEEFQLQWKDDFLAEIGRENYSKEKLYNM